MKSHLGEHLAAKGYGWLVIMYPEIPNYQIYDFDFGHFFPTGIARDIFVPDDSVNAYKSGQNMGTPKIIAMISAFLILRV